MPAVGLVLAATVGYLLGAIPSGVIIGRLRGIDPRAGGSGRTGATNAMRTLGTGLAALVALADVLKGIGAVLLAAVVATAFGAPEAWGSAIGAIAAVAGHVRSVFIGFAGGRGVATGGGAMLVLAPVAILAAIPIMILTIWRTRYVSLGSILAAMTVAAVTVGLVAASAAPFASAVAAALIAAIVVAAHADNLQRLRQGTERRIGGG